MRNVELSKLLRPRGNALGAPDSHDIASAPPLLAVLVRRWRTLAVTVLVCLAGAASFLALATRTYRATATIYVQQSNPRVSDGASTATVSPGCRSRGRLVRLPS